MNNNYRAEGYDENIINLREYYDFFICNQILNYGGYEKPPFSPQIENSAKIQKVVKYKFKSKMSSHWQY